MISILKVEKNGKNVKITLSDSNVITISKKTFQKFRFYPNQSIDDIKTIKQIELEDKFNLALRKALSLLKVRNHFIEEIRKKLRQRKVEDEIIEKVLDYLVREHLLDDNKIAQQYITEMVSKNFGPLKIRNELIKRGVKKEIIDDLMNSLDESLFFNSAKKILNNYLKSKKDLTKSELSKTYRYLLSRGYDYEIINKLFKDISNI